MNLENKLINQGILVKNAIDESLIFTEEFKKLFEQEIEETTSILNYIPCYSINAKKVTIPQLTGLTLKSSLYVRLANELKVLGRHEEGQATQKWVTEFMKANLKGDALVIMSEDMPLKISDFDISNGKYTVFGKECIFVQSEIFNGMIIVDKKAIEFYQARDKESYIDEISGNRKNVTYFGIVDYCNFLIKNPDKCYSFTMVG